MNPHHAKLAEWNNDLTEFVMVYRQIPAERRTQPVCGEWSARQLLEHLMDTEIVFSTRMRAAIANPGSSILPFDQDLYEARVPNRDVPDALLLDALAALRALNLAILRAVPDDAWSQTVEHPEAGAQTLERIVEVFGSHLTEHLDDIRSAGPTTRSL